MNGGTQVVGLWPDRESQSRTEEVLELPVEDIVAGEEFYADDGPGRDWPRIAVTIMCVAAALAWLGFLGALYVPLWLKSPPSPDQIALGIALASSPLAVIGLFYTFIARNSRSEAARFALVSSGLREENARLESTLTSLTGRLAAERAGIAGASSELLTIGDDAAVRMKNVTEAMRAEIDTLTRHAHALKHSAAAARADVAVLLSDLPKAHVQTRDMITALDTAGMTAHERAGALESQLASLSARGREADEIAGSAAQKLAAHLARIEGVSETAGARLEAAAVQMTEAVDAALDRAATASDAARKGMEAQSAAMLALVDQSQAALAKTGAESAEAVATRVDDVTDKIETLGALLATQSETTKKLLASVREGLDALDGRFASLDETGTGRADRLTTALAALGSHAATLTGTLEKGTSTADALIGRTETLMTALDASVREIDETLPAAFSRLDAKAEASQRTVSAVAPEVDRIERTASSTLDRLMEAEGLLAKQRATLDGLAADTDARLAASRDAAVQLVAAVESAEATTRTLAEGAGAQLVEALVRVRETAQQAAERAREAIERVIPEAAERLSEASRDALAKAITEQVEVHIAELGATAERAVETAHSASDRLMRQMLTIAETSAAVESRIADARAEVEENDRDNFARRVALLIESLNSTAIDVTKILSNDVTDSAWAAYLRGDRGVFTRRAVRLLDSGEVREIVRHYDDEPEFREQVNRYVHDFESMLRNILATRDASPLGVTLLSSDMGKLYVALAQAIQRLRS